LSFLLSRFQPDFKSYRVNVELLNSKNDIVASRIFDSKGMEYDGTINVATLLPGRYKVKITPIPVGKEKSPIYELDYAIPTSPPVWSDNQCGISDKVPPPWTDLKILPDNTVECWGRKYIFGKSLFPEQIISGKYELLKKPVSLIIDGKTFAAPCKIKVVKNSATAVELECSGQSGQLALKTNILIEYDGFMWIKLELSPQTEISVSNMKLEVVLKKDCASLFNLMRKFYYDYEAGFQGAVTDKTISTNLYQFNPVIWLGNEDVGLEWFAETLKGWHNADKNKSLQVISSGNSETLQLNLIDSKLNLKQPRYIEFGFQATPVRPLPENWRNLRDGRNMKIWFPWEKIHNIPDAEYKKNNYAELRKDYERKYERPFHYFAGFTMSPLCPEWPWWCDLWSKNPPTTGTYMGESISGGVDEWLGAYVCANSKSLENFYTWKFNTAQKQLDIKNIYVDNQCAQRCMNSEHGCGWLDDSGNKYETWNLLGTRRLTQRLYTMVKAYNPDGMVIRHMSSQLVMPVISFADILVDGELYMGPVSKDESYYNVFDPAMFRASYMSRQFGLPNLFIPQFERALGNHNKTKLALWKAGKVPGQMEKVRHFKGYFLVHDAKVYPLFGVSMDDIWKIEDDFKMAGNTPFFGYWDKNNPFKIANQNSGREMLSAYVDQGKIMLIAMNDTGSVKQMNIKIDSDKLPQYGIGKIDKFINPETNAEVEVNSNSLTLDVKPRDYQILVYKQ
ncbi:MAG: glycoside hydrolase domain-containing protein, partial [Victivallaceae bacterium]